MGAPLLVIAAAALTFALLFASRIYSDMALHDTPESARRLAYPHVLEWYLAFCTPTAGQGSAERCRARAELLAGSPECDQECVAAIAAHRLGAP